ncbi:Ldh family oxidoreductase [Oceanobacillus sp. FSL W8-0428]|uniref:Ldh family oxidoreductase n=1 Tax=Oceanobacillus sp. FSL W8-0428 TaxID=2921715 RepID=UPI0030FD172E
MYIDQNKIMNFSNNCFIKLGMPEEEANIITEVMLEADLRGIHSHGFLRLPIYVERIQKGLIKNKAEITEENNSTSSLVVNGNYSAGQVAGKYAMEKSIEIAEENGVGLVAVKNSNHFGITAFYPLLAAQKDKIGIVISNVAPLMPAIGGKEKVIGNNPISIAAPSKEKPIVLDMALSNTALGKVIFHKENNMKIPKEWGVDAEGVPTDEPEKILNGGLLSAVGGPKGFGLAVMAEILTGVLSGGDFSKMIPSMYDTERKQSISHFMLTIDIKKLIPLETYYSNIDQLISFIKHSSKAEGVEEIYMPGEIEFMKEENNRLKGIPMEHNIFNQLNELAVELNVEGL